MNTKKIIVSLVAAAVVVFGIGGTAAADEADSLHENGEYQGIVGTVGAESDITAGVLVIETGNSGSVEVLLGENTTFQAPGQDEVSKDDIEIGKKVAVLASVNTDGTYAALRVMLVPGTPTRRHLSGVVVSVKDGVMTMINAAGENLTVELPEGVRGGVVGNFISMAVRNQNGKHIASGVCTAEEIQARLRAHLDAVAGLSGNLTGNQTREQMMTRLGDEIEGLCLRNKSALNKVMAKAPESAKTAVKEAIGECDELLEQNRQRIRDAKNRVGFGQSDNSVSQVGRGSNGR